MDEWRGAIDPDVQGFSALEKNAVRTRAIQADESLEIAPLIAEVVIVGGAERHRDVG